MRQCLVLLFVVTLSAKTLAQTTDIVKTDDDPPFALEEKPATPPPPDMSGMGRGGMGGPGGGAPGYTITWIPTQQVEGQQTNLQMVQQNLSFGYPVYRGEGQMVLLNGRVQNTFNQTDAILPQSQRPLPEQLWNVSVGAMYIRQFEGGSSLGVMANLGSASDRPFNELRDYSPMMLAFYRLPVRERDAWMFSLMYSPVGEIAFPLPGVSYQYQPSDNFRMNIGVPFSMMYRPCEELTLDFNYMLLRTISAQATWKLTELWSVYARYAWASQSWFLSDRIEDRERLFYYDMRLMAGARYAITDRLQLDLSAGYVFDRFYFTGTKSSDMQNDRLDVGSGLVTTLSLQVRF